MITFLDIADCKKTEVELLKPKEAHRLGEFLANMGHEIRRPMNGILGKHRQNPNYAQD